MKNESSSPAHRSGERDGERGRAEPGSGPRIRAVVERAAERGAASRERVALGAGGAALAAVAAATALTVLRNLPSDPVAVPGLSRALVAATPFVVGVALVAVAVASRRDVVRVGLLFAGVFGLLAATDAGAVLPATVALIAGGGVALLGGLGRPTTYRGFRLRVIAALVVAGVAVSLASTAGLIGVGFRGPGGVLALGGLATLGIRAEGDRFALLAGGVVVALAVVAAASRPFVVGSGLLVGLAAVDVPHLLVALALGGGTAAAVAGIHRGEYGLAVGAGLLVVAGVPATLSAAMAVVLGASLALLPVERLLGTDRGGGESGGVSENRDRGVSR
jgi:hypothetical protein